MKWVLIVFGAVGLAALAGIGWMFAAGARIDAPEIAARGAIQASSDRPHHVAALGLTRALAARDREAFDARVVDELVATAYDASLAELGELDLSGARVYTGVGSRGGESWSLSLTSADRRAFSVRLRRDGDEWKLSHPITLADDTAEKTR